MDKIKYFWLGVWEIIKTLYLKYKFVLPKNYLFFIFRENKMKTTYFVRKKLSAFDINAYNFAVIHKLHIYNI